MSGWGTTANETTAQVLQHVMTGFSPNRTDCMLKYANLQKKPVNITDNMICGGGILRDSCQGDSGGPLTCFKWNKDKHPEERFLCGIVSFGVEWEKYYIKNCVSMLRRTLY